MASNELDFHLDNQESFEVLPQSEVSPLKRQVTENYGLCDEEADIIKQLLSNISNAVCRRLEAIDNHLETILINANYIDDCLEQAAIDSMQTRQIRHPMKGDERRTVETDTAMLLLNSEDDFPDGVCLGNPDDPMKRVWVPISPSEMANISTSCDHPTKMAVTLVEYLLDSASLQASGVHRAGNAARRKRPKLSELFLYGIQCHLEHVFGISTTEWVDIRWNIDSKCRSIIGRHSKESYLGRLYPSSLSSQPNSSTGLEEMKGGEDEDGEDEDQTFTCIESTSDDNLDNHCDELGGSSVNGGPLEASTVDDGPSMAVLCLTPQQLADLIKSSNKDSLHQMHDHNFLQ